MSNIKSHLDTLENLASNFDVIKGGQIYQKDQLIRFKSDSKFHINFTDCFVAICPNGGLIAICKKHGFFDVKRSSTLNKFENVKYQAIGTILNSILFYSISTKRSNYMVYVTMQPYLK